MSYTDRILAQPRSTRRVLALVFIPMALALFWNAIVVPVRWVTTSQDEWRDETRTTLARARGHATSLDSLQKQVDALPAAPVWARFYGTGGAEGSGAAVQQDVATLCAAAGLENPAISALPAEKSGALTRFTIRVATTGSAERLKVFLAKLREQPHYLRVDRLNVSAPQAQSSDQNPVLTINMDIAGFAGELPAAPGSKST
jgi:hypothetical protein